MAVELLVNHDHDNHHCRRRHGGHLYPGVALAREFLQDGPIRDDSVHWNETRDRREGVAARGFYAGLHFGVAVMGLSLRQRLAALLALPKASAVGAPLAPPSCRSRVWPSAGIPLHRCLGGVSLANSASHLGTERLSRHGEQARRAARAHASFSRSVRRLGISSFLQSSRLRRADQASVLRILVSGRSTSAGETKTRRHCWCSAVAAGRMPSTWR